MAKRLVSRGRLESLLLEKIRAHPGGETANYSVEGNPNWSVGSYDAEATESAVRAAIDGLAGKYDLAEDDADDGAK
jgi:hypothetical protein